MRRLVWSELCEGEQGFPDVGGAIVEGGGNLGQCGGNLRGVILDEPSAFAGERSWVQKP